VLFGDDDLQRSALGGDGTEEAQGPGTVIALLLSPGQRERLLCALARLAETPGEEISLAESAEPRGVAEAHRVDRSAALDRLLEEGKTSAIRPTSA
jgi:hypothetical protein